MTCDVEDCLRPVAESYSICPRHFSWWQKEFDHMPHGLDWWALGPGSLWDDFLKCQVPG